MLIGERKGKKGIGRSSKEGHIYPLSSRQSSLSLASVLPPGPAATRFIFYLSYIITKAKVTFFFFFFLMLFLYQDFCLSLILLLTFLCFVSSPCLSGFILYRNFSPYCYYPLFFSLFLFYVFLFQQYKKKNGFLKISQQANRVQNLESARVLVFFFSFNLLG